MTGSELQILVAAAFATSVLSGMAGMAGGMVLMAVLVRMVPLPVAMLLHGSTQLVANGSRAWLLRDRVGAGVLLPWVAGTVFATFLLSGLELRPTRAAVEIALGLVCLAATLPATGGRIDPRRPSHAFGAGAGVAGCQLVAGVAGPLLDAVFVGSRLGRHEVVATKAATQVLGHAAKLVFWALALAPGSGPAGVTSTAAAAVPGDPAWIALPATAAGMAIAAVLGTGVGRRLLDRLDESGFRTLTRALLGLLGLANLASGTSAAFFPGVPSAP